MIYNINVLLHAIIIVSTQQNGRQIKGNLIFFTKYSSFYIMMFLF